MFKRRRDRLRPPGHRRFNPSVGILGVQAPVYETLAVRWWEGFNPSVGILGVQARLGDDREQRTSSFNPSVGILGVQASQGE